MKIESDKINFRKMDDHISMIYHETDIIKFWTGPIKAPFGVDENFGKHYIRLELDENIKKHAIFKKIISKMESIVSKKLDLKEEELKPIARRKIGEHDLLDIRLKEVKSKIQTECVYENVRDSYLKTIYEIEPNSMVDVYVEIHGIWDYREKDNSSTLGIIGKRKLPNEEVKVIKEDQEVKRVGLIVNALKIKVLDIQKPMEYSIA
jgi:hypothetical protein